MQRNLAGLVVSLCLALILAACSSSGSHHQQSTISGTVSDGYVSGATLTVYRSAEMTSTNVIGSGSTSSDGSFSLSLTEAAPATIYIKSEGGIDVSTGLSAPVMLFAGTAGSDGHYNISPLTDAVYKYSESKGGLDLSASFIATALGINSSLLWLDPVQSAGAAAAMNKVLAAGTQGSSLMPGSYYLDLVFFSRRNLSGADQAATVASSANLATRVVRLPITLGTNMAIDTTVLPAAGIDLDSDGSSDHLYIAGGVTGSSFFIAIDVNDPNDNMAPGSYAFMLSGEVGPFGSLAGSCQVRMNGGGGTLYQGLFAADITPQNVTAAQADVMYAQLAATVASPQPAYLMFSDLLVAAATTPKIGHGQITLTADGTNSTANGFDYSALTADTIRYSGAAVANDSLWSGLGGDCDYLTGPAAKSRLLCFKQGNYLLILPAGGRRGLFVHTTGGNVVDRVGQINLTRSDALAPVLEEGDTYRLASANVGRFLVGQDRLSAQTAVVASALLDGSTANDPTITVPTGSRGSGYDATNGIYAVSGAFMAFNMDADANFSDGPSVGANDHLLAFEMYESGAMTGVRLAGGQANLGAYGGLVNLYDTPFSSVMFAQKSGTTAPGVDATFKFMAREIVGGAVVSTIPVSSVGTLTIGIDAGAASGTGRLLITAIDGSGYNPDDPADSAVAGNTPASTTLTVERISATGLLHIYGSGTYSIYYTGSTDVRDYYWDIYWPIGSPKAAYFFSFKNAGSYIVNEVGEAYVSY